MPEMKLVEKCRLIEGSKSLAKIATAPTSAPREKHAALECHHFMPHVEKGLALVESIRVAE